MAFERTAGGASWRRYPDVEGSPAARLMRCVGWVVLVAVLAAGCASSGGSGGSLVVDDPGEASAGAGPARDAGGTGDPGEASAGAGSAGDAGGTGDPGEASADAGPAGGAGAAGDGVLGTFTTPVPPVRDLTGVAAAHDAVRLSWDGPDGWSPVGYALQWRPRGANAFAGRLELPPGRRAQTVEGLNGGVEYVFHLTARTAAGTRSEPATVAVTTPAAPDTDLTLAVSVPAYCVADEGSRRGTQRIDVEAERVHDVYRRVDVASVPLQWRISGGRAPYTLTVLGTEHSGATGNTEVSCARAGIDLEDLPSHETSVVEAGPKTLTIEATDATGASTTKTHTIEIIEAAHTASDALDGDYLQPGHIYSFFGLFIEIPEGARIAYSGVVEANDVYDLYHVFTEPPEGSRWTEFRIITRSGDEAPPPFGRVVNLRDEYGGDLSHYGAPFTDAENAFWDLFLANIRTTPFPAGDPRNEPPVP